MARRSRRPRGEGTLFRDGDGQWVARLQVGGRVRVKKARTQRECADWLADLKRQAAGGVDVNDTSTVAEYLEHWLSVARAGLTENSWAAYCQSVRDHIVPFVGDVRLADLRPDQVQRMYSERLAGGVGAYAVRRSHLVLHRALGQAVRWRLVVRNVASLVEKPALPRSVARALSTAEVHGLLLAARGERLEGLYYVAIVTGMRVGELLGLRWSDVDWERQGVSVSRQVTQVSGEGLVFGPVKSAAGNRLVALGGDGLDALRDQRARVDSWRGFAGERWVEHDLIFPNFLGKPLDGRQVRVEFRAVCERAGLAPVRFHDLRHTSASLMLRARVPARVVSERLGHSDVGITLNVYSHVVEEMQSEAAAAIESAVRPISIELPR
jgi:integrase